MLVLPVLLAALSAAVWGTGDFSGGKATQRSNALAVTVLSQVAGLPVLAGCVAIFGGNLSPAGLGWGAVAGVLGFLGILLLYRGLAQGMMAIFAPISAVTSALVPMLYGLLTEEWPGIVPVLGALIAVIAVGLVSLGGGEHARVSPRLIGLALGAGICFGVFFIVLVNAGEHAGMWPLVGVRIGSLSVGLRWC